jgi:hypothetical protein
MKLNSLFTSIMVLLCGQLLAAVPTAINYQGRLANAGGTVVPDGSYSIVFTIYDAASGGTSKWTETQSVTTSGGLFAVLLGSITPVTDTVFNGAERYLGVKVGADPELTPRKRLLSVPYADRVSTVNGSTGGAISGNIDLETSSAAAGNILKAGTPFIHNKGVNNTFVGLNAGNLTMSGTDNTIMGALALQNNLSGTQNTAIGVNSLRDNSSGNYNTAAGLNSLYHNTSGSGNAAYGHLALLNNLDGNSNSAFGKDALFSNISGDSNTATGFQALFYNTSSSNNTANGFQALLFNTGNDNTAVGFQALLFNSIGSSNSACGGQALNKNTIGDLNSAMGQSALANNIDGSENTAIGDLALFDNTSGTKNTAVGGFTMGGNFTGDGNTAIGYYANVSTDALVNATAIGFGALVDASNKIRLGNSAVSVIEGRVAYTFTSDRNQKENFQPVDGDEVLRKILGMSLTSWNYKNNDPKQFRHYGPVAQEFFAAFGDDGFGTCGDSISINSGDMAGIMMIAIQTLEKEKKLMKTENAGMKAENAELKARLEKVEATLLKIAGMVSSSDMQLGSK